MTNGGDARAHWDRKYERGLPSLDEPDPFFVSSYEKFVNLSFPNAGAALDVAGGAGRHSLWLANRSWRVTLVDISEVALSKVREAASQLSVDLQPVLSDAADYKFEPSRFDLIVLFYHLDRRLFPKIVSALKPSGLFICKMAVRWDSESGSPNADDHPLNRGELASLVPSLSVIAHDERPVRDRGVVEFVGKLPS